jgi:hypothetical protein
MPDDRIPTLREVGASAAMLLAVIVFLVGPVHDVDAAGNVVERVSQGEMVLASIGLMILSGVLLLRR